MFFSGAQAASGSSALPSHPPTSSPLTCQGLGTGLWEMESTTVIHQNGLPKDVQPPGWEIREDITEVGGETPSDPNTLLGNEPGIEGMVDMGHSPIPCCRPAT